MRRRGGFWHDRTHARQAALQRHRRLCPRPRRCARAGSAHRRTAGSGQAAWPAQCTVPADRGRSDPLDAAVHGAVADPAAAETRAGAALPAAISRSPFRSRRGRSAVRAGSGARCVAAQRGGARVLPAIGHAVACGQCPAQLHQPELHACGARPDGAGHQLAGATGGAARRPRRGPLQPVVQSGSDAGFPANGATGRHAAPAVRGGGAPGSAFSRRRRRGAGRLFRRGVAPGIHAAPVCLAAAADRPDRVRDRPAYQQPGQGWRLPATGYRRAVRRPGQGVAAAPAREHRLALERASMAGRLNPATPGGHYLRGAFFLGSHELYEWLADTAAADPDAIDMCAVSNVNQLYGDHQALATLQRRDARFFNTCMMATLLGAVVSDTLEDGAVVSGVGGQYNFVAMAHELPGGRSVLLLRATRRSAGGIESNIRWHYGQTTIPRHLRDIVVTEYGIADLRGKSDSECIEAMLAICDARFLDALCAEAKSHGKLAADFVIPTAWRRHQPPYLESLAPFRRKQLLPRFPFGSDFDAVEQRLLPALEWLKAGSQCWRGRWQVLRAVCRPGEAADGEQEALRRMGLDTPGSLRELAQRRLLQAALRRQSRVNQQSAPG